MKKTILILSATLICCIALISSSYRNIPDKETVKSDVYVPISMDVLDQITDWTVLKTDIDKTLGDKYVLATPDIQKKIAKCVELYYQDFNNISIAKKGPSAEYGQLGWCWQVWCTRDDCSSHGGIAAGCGWNQCCGIHILPTNCWDSPCLWCCGCTQLFVGVQELCAGCPNGEN